MFWTQKKDLLSLWSDKVDTSNVKPNVSFGVHVLDARAPPKLPEKFVANARVECKVVITEVQLPKLELQPPAMEHPEEKPTKEATQQRIA